MGKIYHYYVEGECEERFINEFKKALHSLITPGKVDVFNFIQNEFTKSRLMALNRNTIIILVYDIDVNNADVLKRNIEILKKYGFNNIVHIQSIPNFEGEMEYAMGLNTVNAIFNTSNDTQFKSKFLKCHNLYTKLNSFNLDVDKLWSRKNDGNFSEYYDKKAHNIIINR